MNKVPVIKIDDILIQIFVFQSYVPFPVFVTNLWYSAVDLY